MGLYLTCPCCELTVKFIFKGIFILTISKELFNYVLNNTNVKEDTGCWEYQGNISKTGYGFASLNREKSSAHRAVYQFLYRKVSLPYMLCHICNNPKCCNPDHLYEGTARENERDSILAGTSLFYNIDQRGENNISSKLTQDIVIKARKLAEEGHTHNYISQRLGVIRRTLSRAITGQSWSNLNDIQHPVTYNSTKGSSPYKGVKINKARGKEGELRYVARIGYKGIRFYIGGFLSEEEAAQRYDYCYQCINETNTCPNGTTEDVLATIQKDTKLNRRLKDFVIKADNNANKE